MSVQEYPYSIDIYKGEDRIVVIPFVNHKSGFLVSADSFIKIQDVNNFNEIGNGIVKAIDIIRNSPLYTMNLSEHEQTCAWRKNSKYKSWVVFWKNNHCASVKYFEDGHYEIYSLSKSETTKGVYKAIVKKIILQYDSNEEEIGYAVVDVFNAVEEYYGDRTVPDVRLKVIELLNKSKLTITPPKDSHFTDNGDSGAAEIYQCYSYATSENAEPTAEFFLGIAPELDCNLDISNVRTSWEDFYGEADYFEMKEVEYGIFKYRIEMKNKDSHKISYILRQDEDLLLECGMEVHSPNRRKKTDEKLEKMFEEFALSCKM